MDIDVVSYHPVEERGRLFYVYIIRTCVAGRTYTVEKRYSDLLLLHKKLKKQLNAPSFPPKQIRNHDPKVLEARRIGLSNYFKMISRGNSYTKTLLDFLDVHHFPSSLDYARVDSQDYREAEDLSDDADEPSHCAVIEYRGDKLFNSDWNCNDIIVAGVFKGLYD